MTAIKEIVASLLLCWGRKASKQVEAFWKSFRGWAVHFIDLTSLYLRLKMGAGRTVKARLVDSKRAASYGFDEQQAPTPNKMKSSKLRLKKRAPIRESHCALAPCIGAISLSLTCPFKPFNISSGPVFCRTLLYREWVSRHCPVENGCRSSGSRCLLHRFQYPLLGLFSVSGSPVKALLWWRYYYQSKLSLIRRKKAFRSMESCPSF
ncbi:hypothetical protein ACOSQ2_003233 [Xanthoceras sorbifolium]